MRYKHDNAYLNFTKKEKRGIISVIFFVSLLLITPVIYSLILKDEILKADTYFDEIAKLKSKSPDSSASRKYIKKSYSQYNNFYSRTAGKETGETFFFDPNTISAENWKRLGVKEKTISTIIKYLSKGGRFKEASDLKKIWGIPPALSEKLMPYVRIEEKIQKNKGFEVYERKSYSAEPVFVDINISDSAGFIQLPGIGAAFSRRIINYRNKLGGFYKIEQVKETFGLPDSVYRKIENQLIISDRKVKQININKADLETLKKHPYVRYHLANAIFQYRQQHGEFVKLEQIRNIMLMTEEIYDKVSPYLSISDE